MTRLTTGHVLSRGAFRPGPGRYPPPFGELAKRHCEYRAGLRNLFAVHFERHRCGNHDIRAVAGDFMELDNLGSAESFTITASRRPGDKFSV